MAVMDRHRWRPAHVVYPFADLLYMKQFLFPLKAPVFFGFRGALLWDVLLKTVSFSI